MLDWVQICIEQTGGLLGIRRHLSLYPRWRPCLINKANRFCPRKILDIYSCQPFRSRKGNTSWCRPAPLNLFPLLNVSLALKRRDTKRYNMDTREICLDLPSQIATQIQAAWNSSSLPHFRILLKCQILALPPTLCLPKVLTTAWSPHPGTFPFHYLPVFPLSHPQTSVLAKFSPSKLTLSHAHGSTGLPLRRVAWKRFMALLWHSWASARDLSIKLCFIGACLEIIVHSCAHSAHERVQDCNICAHRIPFQAQFHHEWYQISFPLSVGKVYGFLVMLWIFFKSFIRLIFKEDLFHMRK